MGGARESGINADSQAVKAKAGQHSLQKGPAFGKKVGLNFREAGLSRHGSVEEDQKDTR